MTSDAPAGAALLVVEDNEIARESLASVLRLEGYAVVTATDGHEALGRLREGLSPALILLDMMLPVCDGWQFLEQRRRDPALGTAPVLITTALGISSPEWASGLGAAGLLRKPIKTDSLLGEIRRCLAG